MKKWITYEWRKFSDGVLQSKGLSSEAELLLQVVGLPEIEIYDTLRFEPFYDVNLSEAEADEEYFPLGRLYDSILYLTLSTGEVLLEQPNDIPSSQFVNADISCFALSIEVYSHFILKNLGRDENEIILSRPIPLLKSRLQSIDPKALSEEDHFWSRILAELKYQLDKDI